jgi:hypothetical protein
MCLWVARLADIQVRPLSGLQALGAQMGKRLGDKLPAFKNKAKL